MDVGPPPSIRFDLARNSNTWQEWDYLQLANALHKWTKHKLVVRDDRKER